MGFCTECGAEVHEDSGFCTTCGAKLQPVNIGEVFNKNTTDNTKKNTTDKTKKNKDQTGAFSSVGSDSLLFFALLCISVLPGIES